MKDEIKSAEIFLENFSYKSQSLGHDVNYPMIEECMRQYAKSHVKAALKAASEKVNLSMYKKSQYSKTPRWKRVSKKEEENGVDLFSYEVTWKPSKSSILNAYNLGKNIK